jgi:hypothetical protein
MAAKGPGLLIPSTRLRGRIRDKPSSENKVFVTVYRRPLETGPVTLHYHGSRVLYGHHGPAN